MDEIKLSRRLLKISDYVPYDKVIVDIGSDHGLLVSYLIKKGISIFAIAGEVNEGPLLATKKQITNLNLEDRVSVRKGNGLEVIKDKEKVDIIVIAGMGGALITDILDKGKEKLNNIERLILQPNIGEEDVRKWLDDNRWNIIDEEILKENGKIYEIIVAEQRRGKNDPVYEIQLKDIFPKGKEDLYKVGPILFQKRSDVLIEKWILELKKIGYVLEQIEKSNIESEKKIKKQEFYFQYQWVNEVIKCLQQDNTLYKYLNN